MTLFCPVEQFILDTNATPSTPVRTTDGGQSLTYRVKCDVDTIICVAPVATPASNGLTNNKLAGKQFVAYAGVVELFSFQSDTTQNYISTIALNGGTGKTYITTGYGE
ncbi:hypothetical protein J0X19_11750 [Hymenobacter sp. BT186]|uniref:Uncharacterized protein n=1 Tax=Hymenobacter telluris TaxID=2816474 RepID=A0A939EWU7_9BACT|nr:hypothetical protein [Hymenobacter telluris]MBO0358621.1 hypothetical protein [Hymenobacter telluris]MBW3374647.1 hypothetical protein [Hymenobacter norwichensis]